MSGGGRNAFLKARDERDRRFFDAGMQHGIQIVHDYFQISLRDPETMGKDIFGRARMERLLGRVSQCDDHFCLAFSSHKEADKRQEEMDALLREIWGKDTHPFAERYPYAKQFGYQKPKKGWVD